MSSRKRALAHPDLSPKRRASTFALFAPADIFDSISSTVSPPSTKVTHYSKPVYPTSKYSVYISPKEEEWKNSPAVCAIFELKELSRILNQSIFQLFFDQNLQNKLQLKTKSLLFVHLNQIT